MDKLYVTYWNKTIDAELGKTEGGVVDIKLNDIEGTKKNPNLSKTKIDQNPDLVWQLLSGQLSIDNKNTTLDEAFFLNQKQQKRDEDAQIIALKGEQWRNSKFYQEPAKANIYKKYIETYLCEITKRTKHLTVEEKIKLLPHAFIEPCNVKILIGKDGVAFKYNWANRPEEITVEIKQNHIVDELLHPTDENYFFPAPYLVWRHNFNGHSMEINGNNFIYEIPFHQPFSLIRSQSARIYYKDFKLVRYNNDNQRKEYVLKFIEIFGDITKSNFTLELARFRAKNDIERWISSSLKSGKVSLDSKVTYCDLKRSFDAIYEKIDKNILSEPELESELSKDENKWILLHGLNYKNFKSHIIIPKEITESNDANMIPDKFFERHDGYWDIIDLKLPKSETIIKKLNRTHFRSEITEYESQIDNYIRTVKEPDVKKHLWEEERIKIKMPKGIILGLRRPEDQEELNFFEECKERLTCELITYDDLLDSCRHHLNLVEKAVQN